MHCNYRRLYVISQLLVFKFEIVFLNLFDKVIFISSLATTYTNYKDARARHKQSPSDTKK